MIDASVIVPSGATNDNDLMVFKANICKHLCKNRFFDRKDFLKEMLDGKYGANAYSKEGLKQAISNPDHEFNKIVSESVIRLCELGLVKRESVTSMDKSSRTEILELLCPMISKYLMPDIEKTMKDINETESKIRKLFETESQSESTAKFLKVLEDNAEITMIKSSITREKLNRLSQLGVIYISQLNTASISPLGRIINKRNKLVHNPAD